MIKMLNRLKNIRIENNLTQIEMAKKLNVTRSSYSVWEIDAEIIPLKHLVNFCNYFNLSLDFYFQFTNNPNYPTSQKEISKELSGNRIKEIRKEKNLTQVKLAKILNTSQSVIAEYESKKNLIGTAFLYTFCSKYKISADYLLGKTDSPKYLE